MAIGNTTQLAQLINRVWDGPFAELISRDEFFLKRFKHVPGGGDGVRWHVQDDAKNTSAGSYSESAGLPTAVAHTYLDARITWRYVWVGVEVTGQMQAQAEGQGGFEGYRDVLQSEIEQSMLDLRSKINDMLLATTLGAGTDIDGIGIPVLDSGVYATIDPAVNTAWASYRNHNSGTPRAVTVALMQDVKTKVEDTPRFGNVSVITTSPTQFNAYGNLLTSLRRFQGASQTLDGGFQALDFETVPLVKVPGHVAGRMYFLTEKDKKGNANFQYRVLQNFKTLDKSQAKADAMYFLMTHYANLQCRNRRTQGVLVDLS